MTVTLYRGGRIYSPVAPDATALLVVDGAVAWVGYDDAAPAGPEAQIVDLAGALVTPALVDAHVHTTMAGLALTGLDLAAADSLATALAAVSAAARTGEVLLGFGWDETRWPEGRAPTAQELDRASGGGSVYLARVDGHCAVAAGPLLEAVRSVAGASADGRLTGEAHHSARRTAYGALGPQQRRSVQRAVRSQAASLGIGCVHEMAGPEISGGDDLVALLALAAAEPGPEVIGHWGGPVEEALALGASAAGGDLFVDGSLGSRTAALREPYADAPDTCGRLQLSAEEIAAHTVACVQAGAQPGFHVIGDAAVAAALAGLEAAAAVVGAPALAAVRPRLEHLEMVGPDEVARLAALGVVASVQPAFDATWGGPDGMYVRRLGRRRAERMSPFAALGAGGVPLAFGSDAPVTPLDPWGGVRAAVHPAGPKQGLSARAAFAAATRGGWRAARIDDAGVLAPGAPATLAVWRAGELTVQAPDARVAAWSTDPRAGVPGLPPLDADAAPPVCLRTVVRGEPVFERHQEGA